jgi:hypothetical protein
VVIPLSIQRLSYADNIQGSLFGPYTPLQQLDILADYGTKSYIVGSTNSLLLQQRDRYSDILINLDDSTIAITSPSLRSALTLSSADRRWIDFITQSVNDTWDESNPGRPKTMGYVGSEEFIRLQFEEYLLSLVASVKCHLYLKAHPGKSIALPNVDGDPALDFGTEWIESWSRTDNYRIFQSITDSHLFDIVEPRHPCAGGLTIDDVQRRIAQQVQEFHLDERFAVGKEVLGRNIAAGKEKASTVFNRLYADMEALRESQRKRHEEAKAQAEKNGTTPPATPWALGGKKDAQVAVQSVGSKAGAYLGSWAQWAGEKRRTGWGRNSSGSVPVLKKEKRDSFGGLTVRDLDAERERGISPKVETRSAVVGEEGQARKESFEESLFDADGIVDEEPKAKENGSKEVIKSSPVKIQELEAKEIEAVEPLVKEVVQTESKVSIDEVQPQAEEAIVPAVEAHVVEAPAVDASTVEPKANGIEASIVQQESESEVKPQDLVKEELSNGSAPEEVSVPAEVEAEVEAEKVVEKAEEKAEANEEVKAKEEPKEEAEEKAEEKLQ